MATTTKSSRAPKTPKVANSAPAGEHIFAASKLTQLAIQWKKCKAAGLEDEALALLDEIIRGSTNMFERLAQHENFHRAVDLSTLISAAHNKMEKWLMSWEVDKGRLFSFLCKCAKNAFRGEIGSQNQFRSRFYTTGDNLEKFFGEDNNGYTSETHEAAYDIEVDLSDLTCRFGCPQERGAIKYLINCIVGENHTKKRAIKGVCYAWGITPDLAKFFYSYALILLRDKMYKKAYVGFTEQDLLRFRYSHTHLIDLLDFVSWDQLKKIITVMGGTRLKIPTLAQLTKMKEEYNLYKDVSNSDLDPDSIESVAKKHKRSPRAAQEIYYEYLEQLNPNRTGEYGLNDD
jgi:hypothetical protein